MGHLNSLLDRGESTCGGVEVHPTLQNSITRQIVTSMRFDGGQSKIITDKQNNDLGRRRLWCH